MSQVPGEEVEVKEVQTPVREIAQSQPVNHQSSSSSSSNTGGGLKVKKKKKKHRRKLHRDPEEIKQIKMQKFNFKREGMWNQRFVNDTIPDLFASKQKRKKSQRIVRRAKSPLQTVYLDKDIIKHKLPSINSKNEEKDDNKKTQKSFNIRTVGGKRVAKKARKMIAQSQKGEERQPQNENKKQEQKPKQKAHKLLKQSVQQRLKAKLQQKTKIYKIDSQYKQLLLDLLCLYSEKRSKQLKTLLQYEINSIGHNKNNWTVIENMIKDRRNKLKAIKQTDQKTTLGTYLKFQLSSVALIQQILKFKAKWEEQFFKVNMPKKINFCYQGFNYLLSMKDQVSSLCLEDSDPFLISRTFKLQQLVGSALKQEEERQRKEMLLKLRACELLLIQQQLLVQK